MAKKKSKETGHPKWRPNFRDMEKLPDIKVIRTDFLFNAIAITAAVALIGILGYREYVASALSSRAAEYEAQIQRLQAQDRTHINRSNEFTREARYVEEVANFLAVPIEPAELLLGLAAAQPEQGRLTSVRLTEHLAGEGNAPKSLVFRIEVNGTMVSGANRSATALIDGFLANISEMEALKPYLITADLRNATRNAEVDQFEYQIQVDLNPVGQEAGK